MTTARDLMVSNKGMRLTVGLRAALSVLDTLDVRWLPIVDNEGMLVGVLSDADLKPLMLPHFMLAVAEELELSMDACVAAFMNPRDASVDVDASLPQIIDLMLEKKRCMLAVTSSDGKLVGTISYQDVLRAVRPSFSSAPAA